MLYQLIIPFILSQIFALVVIWAKLKVVTFGKVLSGSPCKRRVYNGQTIEEIYGLRLFNILTVLDHPISVYGYRLSERQNRIVV